MLAIKVHRSASLQSKECRYLRDALNSDTFFSKGKSSLWLTGPVHHFHAGHHDAGWGCGWNNIQMLSSHLLERSEVRKGCMQMSFHSLHSIFISVAHPAVFK